MGGGTAALRARGRPRDSTLLWATRVAHEERATYKQVFLERRWLRTRWQRLPLAASRYLLVIANTAGALLRARAIPRGSNVCGLGHGDCFCCCMLRWLSPSLQDQGPGTFMWLMSVSFCPSHCPAMYFWCRCGLLAATSSCSVWAASWLAQSHLARAG